MNEVLDSELNSAFVSPEREYLGDALSPYTEGSRLLLMQVRNDDDSSTFFVWAFIYIHLQIKKNKKEIIKLCWDKMLFREKLMEWVMDKSEAEREIATKIVSEMIEEANKGIVEVVQRGGPPGKA